jgi:hypothetical protein
MATVIIIFTRSAMSDGGSDRAMLLNCVQRLHL